MTYLLCQRLGYLHDQIFNNETLPANFTIYCCDRHSHGGGVMLAIRDNIPSQLLSSTSISNLETVTVQIGTNQPLIIYLVYIPPSLTFGYCMGTILQLIKWPH